MLGGEPMHPDALNELRSNDLDQDWKNESMGLYLKLFLRDQAPATKSDWKRRFADVGLEPHPEYTDEFLLSGGTVALVKDKRLEVASRLSCDFLGAANQAI
jgi:hypothetical protein